MEKKDAKEKKVVSKKKDTTKKTTKNPTKKSTNLQEKKIVEKEKIKNAKVSSNPEKNVKKIKEKNQKEVSITEIDKKIKDKLDKIETKTENKVVDNKTKVSSKLTFSLFEVILMIIITILSCLLIFSFLKPEPEIKSNVDDNNVADNEYTETDIKLFLEQYNYILNNYYGEIDKEQLLKDAIEGMLSSLDGYSQVIDQESNSFIVTLTGEYEGVGISIYNDENGNIVIQTIYEGTPAEKAGLKPNDIIIKFNDTNLSNVSTAELVNMISSAEEMRLTVLRGENELLVTLKREKVILKSVNYKMLDNNIGYIDVDIFASNTPVQFKEALQYLEKQKMKSLIIDLRDNTGGHLSAVEEMISLFLDKDYVIYQTEDKNGIEKFYSRGNKTKKYDIVILQNESSASASEIMAAALSENLGAYIIGAKSFGKGTVQTLIDIDNDMQYKFTTKRWLTPKGKWIDGVGISPNLEIVLPIEYYENPTFENDSQLKGALDYLNN